MVLCSMQWQTMLHWLIGYLLIISIHLLFSYSDLIWWRSEINLTKLSGKSSKTTASYFKISCFLNSNMSACLEGKNTRYISNLEIWIIQEMLHFHLIQLQRIALKEQEQIFPTSVFIEIKTCSTNAFMHILLERQHFLDELLPKRYFSLLNAQTIVSFPLLTVLSNTKTLAESHLSSSRL